MKTGNNESRPAADILGKRLGEFEKPLFPEGLEDGIMRKVHVRAARMKWKRIMLYVLAATGAAAAVLGIVYAVLHFSGVDIRSVFSISPALVESLKERSASVDSTIAGIAVVITVVAVFYLSINGVLGNRARKKAMREDDR